MSWEHSSTNNTGWHAIDTTLSKLYNNKIAKHWPSAVPYKAGGADPLDGISAYFNESPNPHWHYVTYGFSELYDKVSDNPELSGWGFEIGFRLATANAREAPEWVVAFLQTCARYVFDTCTAFAAGDYLRFGRPISGNPTSLIVGAIIATDPILQAIDTQNGKLEFLHLFGATEDEIGAVEKWRGLSFINLVKDFNPLMITDMTRKSLLFDPIFAKEIREGQEKEGGYTGLLGFAVCNWQFHKNFLGTMLRITFSKSEWTSFVSMLSQRIPVSQSARVNTKTGLIDIKRSNLSSWKAYESEIILKLSMDTLHEFENFVPKRGQLFKPKSIQDFEIQIL